MIAKYFSKFTQKVKTNQPFKMPRYIPQRNFSSKNIDPSMSKQTEIDKQHKIDQDSYLYDKEGAFQSRPNSKISEDVGEMRSARSPNAEDELVQRSSKFFQPGQRAQGQTNEYDYPTKNYGHTSQKYQNPTQPEQDFGITGQNKAKLKTQPTYHEKDSVEQSKAEDVHELNVSKYSRGDASTIKDSSSKQF